MCKSPVYFSAPLLSVSARSLRLLCRRQCPRSGPEVKDRKGRAKKKFTAEIKNQDILGGD